MLHIPRWLLDNAWLNEHSLEQHHMFKVRPAKAHHHLIGGLIFLAPAGYFIHGLIVSDKKEVMGICAVLYLAPAIDEFRSFWIKRRKQKKT